MMDKVTYNEKYNTISEACKHEHMCRYVYKELVESENNEEIKKLIRNGRKLHIDNGILSMYTRREPTTNEELQ